MLHHKTIHLNGVNFHYMEAGEDGPPLILLHGFNDSSESHLPVMSSLAVVAHVYAFDFRGHGESGHTPEQYTQRNHVYDVEAFMQRVTGTTSIVAGHSMGGLVAGWLAARNPTWVTGLILEDSDIVITPENRQGYTAFAPIRDQLNAHRAANKSFDEYIQAVAQSPAPPVYPGKTRLEIYGEEGVQRHARQRWAMDITHYDSVIDGRVFEGYYTEEITPLIQCPTCCITSSVWTPREILAAIRNSTHVVIDTVDHRVHEMQPNEYVEVVKNFILQLMN